MAKLTRKGFLEKTSAGALAVGALGIMPSRAGAAAPAQTPAARGLDAAVEPFVVYVRNPSAGELVLLAGTQESTHTDPNLVARLWQLHLAQHAASATAARPDVR